MPLCQDITCRSWSLISEINLHRTSSHSLCQRPKRTALTPTRKTAQMPLIFHGKTGNDHRGTFGLPKAFTPQPEVLAHPAVKMFLSHCGWGGITDAWFFTRQGQWSPRVWKGDLWNVTLLLILLNSFI